MHLHPLEASDLNFQTIWIPKGILAKNLSEKKAVLGKHSYLNYDLEHTQGYDYNKN